MKSDNEARKHIQMSTKTMCRCLLLANMISSFFAQFFMKNENSIRGQPAPNDLSHSDIVLGEPLALKIVSASNQCDANLRQPLFPFPIIMVG